MFLKEVKLAKADKILEMRATEKLAQLAVTMIPYDDIKYWSKQEWAFMLDNVVMHTANGFYIRSILFKTADDVPSSPKAEEVS
jgi:hypothetical protein